ncbi:hypothetical protein HDU93_004776, partial [Gonapodya sp. JEL0774]
MAREIALNILRIRCEFVSSFGDYTAVNGEKHANPVVAAFKIDCAAGNVNLVTKYIEGRLMDFDRFPR